jgi:hypothetical protein
MHPGQRIFFVTRSDPKREHTGTILKIRPTHFGETIYSIYDDTTHSQRSLSSSEFIHVTTHRSSTNGPKDSDTKRMKPSFHFNITSFNEMMYTINGKTIKVPVYISNVPKELTDELEIESAVNNHSNSLMTMFREDALGIVNYIDDDFEYEELLYNAKIGSGVFGNVYPVKSERYASFLREIVPSAMKSVQSWVFKEMLWQDDQDDFFVRQARGELKAFSVLKYFYEEGLMTVVVPVHYVCALRIREDKYRYALVLLDSAQEYVVNETGERLNVTDFILENTKKHKGPIQINFMFTAMRRYSGTFERFNVKEDTSDDIPFLSAKDRMEIVRTLFVTLENLHTKDGIAVDDIKRDNLFYLKDEKGKIIPAIGDFGSCMLKAEKKTLSGVSYTEVCKNDIRNLKTSVYPFLLPMNDPNQLFALLYGEKMSKVMGNIRLEDTGADGSLIREAEDLSGVVDMKTILSTLK